MYMDMNLYPSWVYQNPERYIERLKYEARELYAKFPLIGIYREGGTMWLEGPVITMSRNKYFLRIVYPDQYPSVKPDGYVRDEDVVNFCNKSQNQGHNFHNFGYHTPHGLKLCLMNQNDAINKGWTPNQTGITILEYAILWLHAYEFKRARGNWPLPE
jgi:hypothetical protein